jgi:hypothetical protein
VLPVLAAWTTFGAGDFYTGCSAYFVRAFEGDDAGPDRKLLAKGDLADFLREGLPRGAGKASTSGDAVAWHPLLG